MVAHYDEGQAQKKTRKRSDGQRCLGFEHSIWREVCTDGRPTAH